MLDGIKAAIFDMDGTLIDSMWVWNKVDIEFLKKRNIIAPCDLKKDIEYLNFTDTAKYFKKRFNLSESIKDIKNEWNSMAFKEYANNVKLKPAVKEFLNILKERKIKIGLATSNCDSLLEVTLKNTGIYNYFDCITTAQEVTRGKNFPDIYLLCAKKLKVSPENCIVFEDILPAVLGAKSAGMKVVGVHDLYSDNQKDDIMKLSDFYIFKYDEITNAV
ncbi:HAD family hydrolase [Clostridium rectalis]|uniref:HAD family hydrolase n=1 Tax=Clostridium rectalis TaxID=2040295 RepID=UPI000F63FEF5|nr:HAD family phosphatase [Clostridium rectalis]